MQPVMDRLLSVAGDHGGYLTVGQAAQAGVGAAILRKYAAKGRLLRCAQGLYRLASFPHTAMDEYHRAALWPAGRGVISHESALLLWDLADVNPRRIHVTAPYRPRRKGAEPYRLWVRDLARTEIDEVQGVPVVTPAVAIRDVAHSGTDPRMVQQAIARALRRELIDQQQADDLHATLTNPVSGR